MNDDNTSLSMLNNVCTEQQVGQVMANRRYSGLTPFGTKLRQKVIDGIVLPKLRQPRKPFLVIGITDMSAMAGAIGAGGLGDFALRLGYQRFNDEVTWAAVAVIVVLVQLVQVVVPSGFLQPTVTTTVPLMSAMPLATTARTSLSVAPRLASRTPSRAALLTMA